ncbi:MAG: hypothetical protein ISS48_02085 [Candidatus Aenigmarchaeota archaeon]|nr:hypothetical protein [Candidatus Aenigmarchaeota archaeon]
MLKNVKADKSISEIVREQIETMPYVKTALELDLLNFSAFSRHLIPKIEKELGKKVSNQAVTVAIIRYQKDMKKTKISKKLRKGIADCNISMRSDVIDLTLERTPEAQEIVEKFNKEIDWKRGGIMFVVQGRAEVEVILDRENYNKIKENIPENLTVNVIKKLSLISVHQPSTDLTFVPGFYTFLLDKLSMNNINVLQIMSTLTELIIVVSQEQAPKTHEILNDLIGRFRNSTIEVSD